MSELSIDKLQDLSMVKYKKFLEQQKLEILLEYKTILDDLYYNGNDTTFPDERYDMLKDALMKRDSSYVPAIGSKVREGDNKIKLPFWLGSADKITEEKSLTNWKKQNVSKSYVISDKLDGVSCLVSIGGVEKPKLYTRGDGYEGADISHLFPFFAKSFPVVSEHIYVRGELIMSKKTFQERHKNTYKNPRNMVSGLISGKTARDGLEDVEFIAYEIVGDSMPKPSVCLAKLKKLGFKTVSYINFNATKENPLCVKYLQLLLTERREKSKYEIDGIIIQSDLEYDRNTSSNPDYLFAFKMLNPDCIVKTKVVNVEWNVSKWKQLKPVLIVEPVDISGVTISRVTAHNAVFIEENNVGAGTELLITRSNDVIPFIVKIVKSTESDFPESEYTWDDNHVNIVSNNQLHENESCIKLLAGIFDKLGIKYISKATVKKLYENGYTTFLSIITAEKEDFLKIPTILEKSAERIYTNIRNGLKEVNLATLLGASGVLGFGVGKKRIEALLLAYPNIFDSKEGLREKILSVEGFSEIMTDKIVENFSYARKFIKIMKPHMVFKKELRVSDSLRGKKVVTSGFRNKQLEEQVASMGGKITSTVSKQTSFLVVKTKNDDSAKIKKARELSIKIMEIEEFQKFLEKL